MSELIEKLESKVGPRKIVSCPKYCDDGMRGCDACNYCGTTGSGFYLAGKFFANTEEGWTAALASTEHETEKGLTP